MEAHATCPFSNWLAFGSRRCISRMVGWQYLHSDHSQGNSAHILYPIPHCHRPYQPPNCQAWSGPVLSQSIHLVVSVSLCSHPLHHLLRLFQPSNSLGDIFLNPGPDPGLILLSLLWKLVPIYLWPWPPAPSPSSSTGVCLETPCRALSLDAFRHLLKLALCFLPPTVAKTSSNKQRIRVEKRYVNVQQQTNRQHYPEVPSKLELIWP